MLHRLVESVKQELPLWKMLKMFRRFIDDIFGLWYGTKRQFESLVAKLNELSAKFGIRFGDWSIGESVNFLDVTLYVDSEGFIQYKLYRKPTDSRLYLKTHSFHPGHVFDSVAYSQFHRVRRRSSSPESTAEDLEQLKLDLIKCGHNEEKLQSLMSKSEANPKSKVKEHLES